MDDPRTELALDPDHAMVGGVCAGLGRHFAVDPALFRALFIASLAVGGFGPAAYVALWILLDSETSAPSPTRSSAAGGDVPKEGPSSQPVSPDLVVTDSMVGAS